MNNLLPAKKPVRWFKPPVPEGAPPAQLKTTSTSRADTMQKCPRQAFLKFGYKIEEPERPGPSPLDRGTEHHQYVEDFITGKVDTLNEEIEFFRDDPIPQLRARFKEQPGTVKVEERWNFTNTWEPCGDKEWDKIWTIMKLDVLVMLDDSEAVAIDWKTGKKVGNEVKHGEQMMVYCIGTLMKYPHLDRVTSELVYLDQDEVSDMTLDRDKMKHFLPRVTQRLASVTEATNFPPNPSKHTCRFCPYKTGRIVRGVFGTGHCDLNPE